KKHRDTKTQRHKGARKKNFGRAPLCLCVFVSLCFFHNYGILVTLHTVGTTADSRTPNTFAGLPDRVPTAPPGLSSPGPRSGHGLPRRLLLRSGTRPRDYPETEATDSGR